VIAMGNSGDIEFVPTLKKLSEDSDPVVAEHARWALATLEQSSTQRPLPSKKELP